MQIPRLGVNIDHVASLRQLRGEAYPSLVEAADLCLREGADQLGIYLTRDRRHIQDTDLEAIRLVTRKFGRQFNLEIGLDVELVEVAAAASPDRITLVPENENESTECGGFNLLDDNVFESLQETINVIRNKVKISRIALLLDGKIEIIEKACLLSPEVIEIHTGQFAKDYTDEEDYTDKVTDFEKIKNFVFAQDISLYAGHGLNCFSVRPLLERRIFEQYNIGHWIVCQSLFDGLPQVVKNLKKMFETFKI